MPEMTVTVRWPDGRVAECYSPSLVMHDHLQVGSTYRVDDFVKRASVALGEASERVRVKYGFTCSASAASRERIERSAAAFAPHDSVEVLDMQPTLEGS
ncbi:MSMEG_0570 family nitrogen starvation response protein [Aeromicrobium chenweiae]|uniref:MSMEG_0570 family nitrogen starvation response protein n=1 Tax=Aeromicrobium chenweiae TaxID=2079793 RepID=A0A2S0WLS7_9ACTN|nr:MSMEG_0570 family nitrogen starvation response protein [Aeromicrobium chenweiae]AWB92293.1 MSMEG_0570 family nitrogen starvation response protein [Aeromicrobium chenweiae]TGN31423.1 MSMEG_0570 family nitrogen starvation response protein [Aeromicrobium chenweiae]